MKNTRISVSFIFIVLVFLCEVGCGGLDFPKEPEAYSIPAVEEFEDVDVIHVEFEFIGPDAETIASECAGNNGGFCGTMAKINGDGKEEIVSCNCTFKDLGEVQGGNGKHRLEASCAIPTFNDLVIKSQVGSYTVTIIGVLQDGQKQPGEEHAFYFSSSPQILIGHPSYEQVQAFLAAQNETRKTIIQNMK